MTDQNEKLAYLLDDFTGDDPSAELDEVISDVNLQYQARRYRMIGDAMRRELPGSIDTQFHSTVMARIRAEAPRTDIADGDAPARAEAAWLTLLANRLGRPLAGFAVAAAVAVVTVTLWTSSEPGSGLEDAGPASAETQTVERLAQQPVTAIPATVSTRVQNGGMRWKVDNDAPALQQKLNAYLVNHTEYSNSVQGLIPQARVAGFDSQQ